jgi:hypothetical protein
MEQPEQHQEQQQEQHQEQHQEQQQEQQQGQQQEQQFSMERLLPNRMLFVQEGATIELPPMRAAWSWQVNERKLGLTIDPEAHDAIVHEIRLAETALKALVVGSESLYGRIVADDDFASCINHGRGGYPDMILLPMGSRQHFAPDGRLYTHTTSVTDAACDTVDVVAKGSLVQATIRAECVFHNANINMATPMYKVVNMTVL